MSRKKKTKRRKGKRSVVLAIDSNSPGDLFSLHAHEYRSRHVYPKLRRRGYRVKEMWGTDVTRAKVLDEMAKRRYGLVIMSGHGQKDRYLGYLSKEVLRVDMYRSSDPRRKRFHFTSCDTGAELGPDLIDNGARDYFGYVDLFFYKPNEFSQKDLEVFFECDAAIDLAMVRRWSSRKVCKRVQAKYRREIKKLEKRHLYLACQLEQQMDRFVGMNHRERSKKDDRPGVDPH